MDCVHIARKGEDSIIDSIPLAEADLILVSEEGNLETQYKRNPENSAFMKSNRSLERQGSMTNILNKVNKTLERQNSRASNIADEASDSQVNTLTTGFKMMQSGKLFHPHTKSLMGKSELLQQEEVRTVLQISTIAEGFNSGVVQHAARRIAL